MTQQTQLEEERQFLKSLQLIHIQPQSQIQPRLVTAIILCIEDLSARQIMLEELNYYIQYNVMSKTINNNSIQWEIRNPISLERKKIEKKFPHLSLGDLTKNFLNCFQDILVKNKTK
jgi:hypothetical protein